MLITPTCSMRAQGDAGEYAHPVRTLVPLRPITELVELGVLDKAKTGLAEKRDSLINYMFIPEDAGRGIDESLALLYTPVTLHHEMIADGRVAQLTYEATRQLQKKLAWHATSMLLDRERLRPPNGLRMTEDAPLNPYDFRSSVPSAIYWADEETS